MPSFEYRHIVGFEETNVVGNVYYTNHIRWQGRCRELFLREMVPEILDEMNRGLAFVTLRVSCEYHHELCAFDELVIRMSLADLSHHRMSLSFEYWRQPQADASPGNSEELVARGQQDLACMGRRAGKFEPQAWPASLLEALRPYAAG
jgi:enediyne biosynthesis thioesterase